jgi:hypothetical protein
VPTSAVQNDHPHNRWGRSWKRLLTLPNTEYRAITTTDCIDGPVDIKETFAIWIQPERFGRTRKAMTVAFNATPDTISTITASIPKAPVSFDVTDS